MTLSARLRAYHKSVFACGALAILSVALPASPAHAEWPSRPVSLVVPYPAGGFTDMLARLTSKELSQRFGQPFVVENRPGASGAVAANYVANAASDGHTFFMATVTQISILPSFQKVPYDPDKFESVSIVARIPFLLAIRPDLPVKTIPEYVAYAKANPGKLNIANAGINSTNNLVNILFSQTAGIEVMNVPYKGSPAAIAAVLSGEVDAYWGGVSDIIPQVKAGKLRVLASSAEKRIAALPDLPTLAEFYPGVYLESWNGYMAAPATPKSIIQKVSEALVEIGKSKTIADQLTKLGISPTASTAEEMERVVKEGKVTFEKLAASESKTK